MKHFALIGTSLKHSYSKEYFDAQHFADADYALCEMPSLDRRWLRECRLDGFNVTSPYKQQIISHLDDLSTEAEAIGAVNCVVVRDGHLIGHNTDAPAFRQTLQSFLQSTNQAITQSFILGTGGAARAVAFALGQLDIPHTFVSRHPEQHPDSIGYAQLTQAIKQSHNHTIIINATPAGLPITPPSLTQAIKQSSNQAIFVYDLNYNPSPTPLMDWAGKMGAHTCDGLAMLHLQAQLSYRLWGLL